jgi:PAS domain S-box-containing protein
MEDMDKQLTTHRGGHLEALLNGCPDAILAINAEGIIKFANREACKLTERGMNELIGESIVEVYESIEAAREANRKIYEGGGTIHDMEAKTRTKTGKLVPVRVSASHLYDSNGKYIGGVGYFAQYRPWGSAEADVKARLEELEARVDAWKGMAAPVFELYPGLTVSVVVGELDAERFEDIAARLLEHVEEARSRVALIDLSGAVCQDVDVARSLAKTIRTIHLLGVTFIIAGMQAALARAIEPLLGDLGLVKSFSNMETALTEALNLIGYHLSKKA